MKSGFLPVGNGHTLYYEEHGTPTGFPVVVLHGGPGGGLQHSDLNSFDLRRWRIVMFDQRGCGRSTPFGSTTHNTTWDLVADIERLRRHLEIDRWVVFGGSWGTTLGLAYAIRHTSVVAGLILRGVCLMETWAQKWLYEDGGVAKLDPIGWSAFSKGRPTRDWRRLTQSYRRDLMNRRQTRRQSVAAASWWAWERRLSSLNPRVLTGSSTANAKATKEMISMSVLETHYWIHNAWLRPGQLLRGVRRHLQKMPMSIVQGMYDVICPSASAYDLHQAAPQSTLRIVPAAGHSAREPGIQKELRRATDELRRRIHLA